MGGGRADLAFGPKAKELDNQIKKCPEYLNWFLRENFSFKKKLNNFDIELLGGIGACEPDGGIFESDKTVLVIEAKHQQDAGNGIERWHNNYNMIHDLYVEEKDKRVLYVTFCSGEGAYKQGEIGKAIHFKHCKKKGIMIQDLKDLDTLHECVPKETSFNIAICSIPGYTTDDIFNICKVLSQLVGGSSTRIISRHEIPLSSKKLLEIFPEKSKIHLIATNNLTSYCDPSIHKKITNAMTRKQLITALSSVGMLECMIRNKRKADLIQHALEICSFDILEK